MNLDFFFFNFRRLFRIAYLQETKLSLKMRKQSWHNCRKQCLLFDYTKKLLLRQLLTIIIGVKSGTHKKKQMWIRLPTMFGEKNYCFAYVCLWVCLFLCQDAVFCTFGLLGKITYRGHFNPNKNRREDSACPCCRLQVTDNRKWVREEVR